MRTTWMKWIAYILKDQLWKKRTRRILNPKAIFHRNQLKASQLNLSYNLLLKRKCNHRLLLFNLQCSWRKPNNSMNLRVSFFIKNWKVIPSQICSSFQFARNLLIWQKMNSIKLQMSQKSTITCQYAQERLKKYWPSLSLKSWIKIMSIIWCVLGIISEMVGLPCLKP